MKSINIEVSEVQYKGLQYASLSPEDWTDNAVKNRARRANDKIVDSTVKYCLDNGIQVPPTREDIVEYAFANGVVKTAAERKEESKQQETV